MGMIYFLSLMTPNNLEKPDKVYRQSLYICIT